MKTISELIAQIYGKELETVPTTLRARGAVTGTFRSLGKRIKYILNPNESAYGLILSRMHAINYAVAHTCLQNQETLESASDLMAKWMREHASVRFLGAGRALLAGSMPGNRMAHGGTKVSFMGGMVPLPNSIHGGGIVACSASGKTKQVLEAMLIAKENNQKILIIGIASHKAKEFMELCDIFIGIYYPKDEFENPLSALADTEEYIISEILDGLVVMAGKKNGFDDETWRKGHEDIGPTGPYSPK